MIRIAALLFAFAIFARPILPLLDYAINYDFIIKELCIDKGNKNTDCKGKCHLKKSLASASHTQENTPDRKSKAVEHETLFFLNYPVQTCLSSL